MEVIGTVFIALYVISGLITTFVAPRIGPNAFLGVRTSVTLADSRIWGPVNRVGGWLLVAAGAGLVPVVILMSVLNLEDGTARMLFLVYVIASLVVLGVWAVVYPPRLQKALDEADRSETGRR